jgi:hypothetical protein
MKNTCKIKLYGHYYSSYFESGAALSNLRAKAVTCFASALTGIYGINQYDNIDRVWRKGDRISSLLRTYKSKVKFSIHLDPKYFQINSLTKITDLWEVTQHNFVDT